MFVLCPDLFYVLPGSLIDVRNGSIRVFVVQIICDCCRACVDLHYHFNRKLFQST